jgi:hypothetical protein
MPVPSCVRPRALDTIEPLKQVGQLGFRDADAAIAHRKLHRILNLSERYYDFTLKGVFECVGDKIQNDLLPHFTIDINRLGEPLAINNQSHAGALDGGTEHACQIHCQNAQSRRLIARIYSTGFNAREVEQ